MNRIKTEMKREANLRLRLEELVEVSPRYVTIFQGLKLNTAHNSAVMEPLSYFLRRLIYAALIVFMPHLPQIQTLILLAVCFATLVFTVVEKPWLHSEMNKLAVVNESLLYLLLILILTSPSFDTVGQRETFGWAMIGVVTLMIHINLIFMLA